jgi:hypothetical protein
VRLCVIAALVGCGGPAAVPVEGVVTLNGAPLPEATVILVAKQGPIDQRTFTGETDSAGRYSIKQALSGEPGVPPGTYNLKITSVKVPPGADELTPLPEERVPREFLDGSQTLEVPEGGLTDKNFDLVGRPAGQPGRR